MNYDCRKWSRNIWYLVHTAHVYPHTEIHSTSISISVLEMTIKETTNKIFIQSIETPYIPSLK